MKIAQSLIGENLKLFGSPWSGPAWMKTMDNMNSLNNNTLKGSLLGNNDTTKWWQTYTNYFYKYILNNKKVKTNFIDFSMNMLNKMLHFGASRYKTNLRYILVQLGCI